MNPESAKTAPSADEDARGTNVLKARARALAQPADTRLPRESLEVVAFRLAEERYAIEQKYVQEIYPLRALTPLPGVPPFYLGIINLRGQILPVIDLKKFFDLPDLGITDLHVVLVVCVDDLELGILADAVSGVRSLAQDTLQTTLPTLTGIRMQFLKGISNEQVVVLDAPKILQDPQLLVNQEMEP
jgi:purine-binding chemotaxis protein CheW